MINCAYDCETAENSRAVGWIDKIHLSAPSNYKDPVKIKAYLDDQRAKLLSKSALSWWTARIVSIAIVNINDLTDVRYCFNVNEKELLKDIAVQLSDVSHLYGKTSNTFDQPMLVGRFLANNLPVPTVLKQKNTDIDNYFGWSSQSSQRGSLDAYLYGLDLEGKPMKGSMVPKMFAKYLVNLALKKNPEDQEHFLRELKEYNIFDSMAVAQIVRKYEGIE